MKSEDIVKTLGYLTLAVISVYVLFGMLEIGGKGLASAMKNNIIEGMEDKQLDRLAEKLQKKLDSHDDLSERFADQDDNLDQIEDLPEYKDMLEIQKESLMRLLRNDIRDTIISGADRKKRIIETYQMLQALEMVGGGGGAGGAAKKLSGGLF